MKKFVDFNFYKVNYIGIIVLFLCVLYVQIFNVAEIYENSLFETLSLIPLFIGFILCLKAKNHKVFFAIVAMTFLLMIMRELNYGRVIFCEIPNQPHEFYPWSYYKYGYLAHVGVGIYIAIGSIYALINKIWVDIIEIVNKIKFPIWTYLSIFALTFVQIHYEDLGKTVIEETAEFTLYCMLLALVCIYLKKSKELKVED